MISRSRPASVTRAQSAPIEQYTLDERELAALEKLYDFPGRAGLASSKVRTVSIIDTLSEMARAPAARDRAQPPPLRLPAGGGGRDAASPPAAASTDAGHADAGCTGAGRADAEVGRSVPAAADAAGAGAERPEPPAAPRDREAMVAQLLAEAARSPPPPIPSRRPNPALLNLRGRPRTRARGQPAADPGGRPDGCCNGTADPERGTERTLVSEQGPESAADRTQALFDLAREGAVDKLRASLSSADPSTICSLVDQRGNNLAHVLAAGGHVDGLSWLADTCGHVLGDTLWEENGRGLTPCLAAVRCGQLTAVQWLAERSPAGSRLLAPAGTRSLLHSVARHGQAEIAAWCADRLQCERTRLDHPDQQGDTPLHLAAKTGSTATCRTLLDRGASVTARNEMGLKPYDVAAQLGHHACAEYLLTFETLADLAADFSSLEAEAARLQAENAEYKDTLREVLSVARKVLRERDDLGRDLTQLHDDTLLLHERLLRQLQLAAAERRELRRRLHEDKPDGADESDEPGEPGEQEEVAALQAKWQHCLRSWCSAPLLDTRGRLQAAEQAWQRLRASRKDGTAGLTGVQEIVRNKIGDIRAQAAPSRLLDSSVLSSSEDSLVDSGLRLRPPTPPPRPAGSGPPSSGSDLTDSGGNSSAPTDGPAKPSLPAESRGGSRLARRGSGTRRRPTRGLAERRGKSVDQAERLSASGGGDLWRSAELSRSLDLSRAQLDESSFARRARAAGSNESVQLARDELRRRLRDLALVSESGSAAVLDVIEPSGSEAGSAEDLVQREVEAQRRARARAGSRLDELAGDPDGDRSGRSTPWLDGGDFLGERDAERRRPRPASSPRRRSAYGGVERRVRARAGSAGRKEPAGGQPTPPLPEPDLLQGTAHSRGAAEDGDEPPEKPDRPLFELTAPAPAGPEPPAVSAKKRGFLHKFAIRARWSPRRRERPPRPGPEITAVEFRETYLADGGDGAPPATQPAAVEAAATRAAAGPRAAASQTAEATDVGRESKLTAGETARAADDDGRQLMSDCVGGLSTSGSADDLLTAVRACSQADTTSVCSRSLLPRSFTPDFTLTRPLFAGGSPCPEALLRSRTTSPCGESARPASAAGRPASSASAAAPTRGPAAGCCSPAPSEASRTESALAPPSELSGTESARHLPSGSANEARRLAGGGVNEARHLAGSGGRDPNSGATTQKAPVVSRPDAAVSEAAVSAAGGRQLQRRDDRPWYEVSDDD